MNCYKNYIVKWNTLFERFKKKKKILFKNINYCGNQNKKKEKKNYIPNKNPVLQYTMLTTVCMCVFIEFFHFFFDYHYNVWLLKTL